MKPPNAITRHRAPDQNKLDVPRKTGDTVEVDAPSDASQPKATALLVRAGTHDFEHRHLGRVWRDGVDRQL